MGANELISVRRAREENYVGIFKKKYTPRNPKIASGAHAASNGGSWPTEPIASNSAAVAQ